MFPIRHHHAALRASSKPASSPSSRRARTPGRIAAVAALLALAAASVSRPAGADVAAASYELIVLARPQPPRKASGAVRDLTLSYRVLEVFAGEPGSVSVVVRHPRLTPAQHERLDRGEKVMLLANRDPDHPGRWLAPMPLRATPEVVASFRSWSAPPDVRPPRDVHEVIAEARQALPARRELVVEDDLTPPEPEAAAPVAPAADTAPAPAASLGEEPSVAVPAPPPAEVATAAEPRSDREAPASVEAPSPAVAAAPVVAAPSGAIESEPLGSAAAGSAQGTSPFGVIESVPNVAGPGEDSGPVAEEVAGGDAEEPAGGADPWSRGIGAPSAERGVLVSAGHLEIPRAPSAPMVVPSAAPEPSPPPIAGPTGPWDSAAPPPLTWDPQLIPPGGPGLPPVPSPRSVLGPPLRERRDLPRVDPERRAAGHAGSSR